MLGTFTKNTLITFITRVLILIFLIGVSIIIARTLGPEGKGIYSLVILFSLILVMFANFGITEASIFYIGKRKFSREGIFGHNIIFTFFISIFTILIGLAIVFFFSHKLFPGVERGHLFLGLSLIPLVIFFNFISHVLLGLQKIKEYNIIRFLQAFFLLILVGILLLGFHLGIRAAIFAQIFAYLFTGTILFFFAKKEVRGITLKFNIQYFKNAFSYGLKSHLGSIFSFLQYRFNIFLVNIFINPIAAGFYSVAVELAEGTWLIFQSTAIPLFPKLASEKNSKALKEFTPLVCRNVLFITLLVAILLFVLSHWIITFFYSTNFLESILPLRILLIGAVSISGWRILTNDLYARGKPMVNTWIAGISATLNIILSILLIQKWGISGAAFATAISYTIAFLLILMIYNKISGNKIRDIIFLQRSDFQFYKNFLSKIINFKRK